MLIYLALTALETHLRRSQTKFATAAAHHMKLRLRLAR